MCKGSVGYSFIFQEEIPIHKNAATITLKQVERPHLSDFLRLCGIPRKLMKGIKTNYSDYKILQPGCNSVRWASRDSGKIKG